jgi:Rod binding domain-containing protein
MEISNTLSIGAASPTLPFEWTEAGLSADRKSTPEGIRAAAAEFEALLVAQMLRSMREASGGWLGGEEQDAAFSLMEMAEQCLATALAAQGGLGLARLVEQSLADQTARTGKVWAEDQPDSGAAAEGRSG